MSDITRQRINCSSNSSTSYTVTGLDSDVYKVEVYALDVGMSTNDIPIIQMSNDGGSTFFSSSGDYHTSYQRPWPGSPSVNNVSSTTSNGMHTALLFYLQPSTATYSGCCVLYGTGKLMPTVFRSNYVVQDHPVGTAVLEGGSCRDTSVHDAFKITTASGTAVFNEGEFLVLIYRPTAYEQVIFKDFASNPSSSFDVTLPSSNCSVDLVWDGITTPGGPPGILMSTNGSTFDATASNYSFWRHSWLITVGGSGSYPHGVFTTSTPGSGITSDGAYRISGLLTDGYPKWEGAYTNRGTGYRHQYYGGQYENTGPISAIRILATSAGTWSQGYMLLAVNGDST